jgi:hypothetical protein
MSMASSEKDFWDKIQAIGALLSGVAVPLVLFVATEKADELQKASDASARERQQLADTSARERELTQGDTSVRVAQANVIPPLIDGLLSTDPKRRKLAISAILIALPADGPNLVRELGTQSEDADVKSYAAGALKNRKDELVSELYANDPDTRRIAARALVDGWRNDPGLAQHLIDHADANKDNPNGVYNSVVVLGGLSQNALAPHREKVESFLTTASTQGTKTAEQAQRVKKRLDDASKPAAATY